VLFDKIVSGYFIKNIFIFKKYIYSLALKKASPENQHCASYIGTLSFPIWHNGSS